MTSPIGLLHGYLLEGSGSNLWTREMVRALCRAGETVHLFCQEPHPEDYDFVAEARIYEPDGAVKELFSRETAYPGRRRLYLGQLVRGQSLQAGKAVGATAPLELGQCRQLVLAGRNHQLAAALVRDLVPLAEAVHLFAAGGTGRRLG